MSSSDKNVVVLLIGVVYIIAGMLVSILLGPATPIFRSGVAYVALLFAVSVMYRYCYGVMKTPMEFARRSLTWRGLALEPFLSFFYWIPMVIHLTLFFGKGIRWLVVNWNTRL